MMNQNNLLKVIPEDIIIESAQISTGLGDSNNSFSRLLVVADEFRQANMTPIFVLNSVDMSMSVVAKETFKQRLN